MQILIFFQCLFTGGGSGFIGTALCNILKRKGYEVVIVSRVPGPYCMTWGDLERSGLPHNTVAVVNLAGQNILDKSRGWTTGFQQTVRASRLITTHSLVQAIVRAESKPKVFVSTSGVGNPLKVNLVFQNQLLICFPCCYPGYYPPSPVKEYTEDSKEGSGDFFANLCNDWEASAQVPPETGVRTVVIRSG